MEMSLRRGSPKKTLDLTRKGSTGVAVTGFLPGP
jgi:hypothetical protein